MAIGTICNAPDSKDGDNESPTDNAVSSLGKIAEYRGNLVDRNALLSQWLTMLPLKGDVEEARLVHEHLCIMIERGENALLGGDDRLLHILNVFAEILASRKLRESHQLATQEVMTRMVKVLISMQTSISANTMAAVWAGLKPECQQTLQESITVLSV